MDDLFGIPTAANEIAAVLCVFFGALFVAGATIDLVAVSTGRLRKLDDPALAARLRARPWALLETAWLLLVLALAWLILSSGASLMQRLARLDSHWASMATMLAWTLLLPAAEIGAISLILARKRLSPGAAFGLDAARIGDDIGTGLLFYIMSIPVIAFYSIAYVLALRWIGQPTNTPQEVVRFMLDPGQPLQTQVFLAGVAVLVAPVAEEVLFRGILLPLAAKYVRLPLAIGFVSLLFAVVHWHLPSVVPLFAIAVALSLGYLYSGSIMVPIAMHAAFNAVSLGTMICVRLTAG